MSFMASWRLWTEEAAVTLSLAKRPGANAVQRGG